MAQFRGTGLSVRAGSAFELYFWTGKGQSNLGTGGSLPAEMPASVPRVATAGRMFAYYKDGLYRLAREPIAGDANAVFPVQLTGNRIGPLEFFLDEVLADPKLEGRMAGVASCAVGGTLSEEWLPSALSPPGQTLYSSAWTQWRNALRRPDVTDFGSLVWQGESNAQSGFFSNENDFTNASWTKVEVTPTLGVAVGPLGQNDAQRLTETAVNDVHTATHGYLIPIIGGSTAQPRVGTTITIEMSFKTGTLATPRNWVYLEAEAGAVRCWFDTNTGTVGTETGCVGTMVDQLNGWWLCQMTYVVASDPSTFTCGLATGDGAGAISYLGDVTADLLCWEANTNALAQRWLPDWTDHIAQWRIDVADATSPFHFINLTPSVPGRVAGSFYRNWSYLQGTVIPQIALIAGVTLTQSADGPWTDSGIHVAVGANASEGQWATGIALAQTVLPSLP